ncbi:MAG: nucleotidyltransferase domain-containing protein [Deltaproteobacteria bacterium]|nr:nucleotidyltransferase domain-containing protein [Deltaproteobacteria bacterium]
MQVSTETVKSKGSIKNILQHIAEKIRDNYHPEKIILFGSYAYGKPNENSDVDIVVIKKGLVNTPSIERSVAIRRILAEENRFLPLTPLVYTPEEIDNRLSLGDDFIIEVLERGKVLYAR